MYFQLFAIALCLTVGAANKITGDSPEAIAINQATLGSDGNDSLPSAIGAGAQVMIDYIGKPFILDIPEECRNAETPEEQFSRITSQTNESIDFSQFLQLDACSTAYRKRDFDKIDTNNDSRISVEEWNAHNEAIRKANEEAELNMRKITFNRLDKNKDKALNQQELRKYLRERMINAGNLTQYLNGESLNFTQFVDFDRTIPNATFPFESPLPIYDYAAPGYAYDYDVPTDAEMGVMEPAVIDPAFSRPAPRPAISVMPVALQGGPMIQPLPAKIAVDPVHKGEEGSMSAAVMP